MNEYGAGALVSTGSTPKTATPAPMNIPAYSEELMHNIDQLLKRMHDLRERLTTVLVVAEPMVDGKTEPTLVVPNSPHGSFLAAANSSINDAHRVITDLVNRIHL